MAGQFGIGLVLGAVWSLCVGPTLGAASVLAGKGGKIALGALFLVAGLLIATGSDRRIEAAPVDLSPAWLTDVTTRF